jgi:hypothetical protein
MKNKVMKKWVKALRSGKYKQGRDLLKQLDRKNQPRHCCLGVLCELYNEEMKKNHKKSIVIEKTNNGFWVNSSLPKVVMNWSGVRDSDGAIENDEDLRLTNLNDSGKGFKTIANIIEKEWENL